MEAKFNLVWIELERPENEERGKIIADRINTVLRKLGHIFSHKFYWSDSTKEWWLSDNTVTRFLKITVCGLISTFLPEYSLK